MPVRRIVLVDAPPKEADKFDKAQLMADAVSRLVEHLAEGSSSEPEQSAMPTSNASSVTNFISGAVGWVSGAVWGNTDEVGGSRYQTSLPEDCENESSPVAVQTTRELPPQAGKRMAAASSHSVTLYTAEIDPVQQHEQHQWGWDGDQDEEGFVTKMEYSKEQNTQIETEYIKFQILQKHLQIDPKFLKCQHARIKTPQGTEYDIFFSTMKQQKVTDRECERPVKRADSAAKHLPRISFTAENMLECVEHEMRAYLASMDTVVPSVDSPPLQLTAHKKDGVPFEKVVEHVKSKARDGSIRHYAEVVNIDYEQESFRIRMLNDDDTAHNEVLMLAKSAWHDAVISFTEIRDRVPETWEPMTDVYETYPVSKESEEYETVAKNFKNDFECEIVEILRIQNKHLWTDYVVKRSAISQKNGGNANEILYLKHGTQGTTPETIYANGVDPNYACGRFEREVTYELETESGELITVDERQHAIKKMMKKEKASFYGPGSYFTDSTKYARNYAYKIDDGTRETTRELVLCRIVAGNIDERKEQDCTIRSAKTGCHSVKGPVLKKSKEPQAHVVYEASRSYPDYAVRFKYQKGSLNESISQQNQQEQRQHVNNPITTSVPSPPAPTVNESDAIEVKTEAENLSAVDVHPHAGQAVHEKLSPQAAEALLKNGFTEKRDGDCEAYNNGDDDNDEDR
jgi:hypothetical protein